MRHLPIILAICLLAVSAVTVSDQSDGTVIELSDGSQYTYRTFGSDFATYRSTIDSVVSDEEVLYIPTVLEGYNVTELNSVSAGRATAIVVPERVMTISEGTFDGCPVLRDLYFMGPMPDIQYSIPDDVMVHHLPDAGGWSSGEAIEVIPKVSGDGSVVEYIAIEGEAMAIGGTPSSDGSLTILPQIGDVPVTSIGAYAFSGRENALNTGMDLRTDITDVTVPEGVERIRERAFFYNGGLTSISMPSTLEVIMDEAFRAASGLGDTVIPEGVTYLGFESFRQCDSFERIVIPDSVTFAGEGTFKVCPSVTSITIGSGLGDVADWMFCYNTKAESVEFRGSPSSIGDSAFYVCESLLSISIPDSVRTIGGSAFFGCFSLTSAEMPSSLASIGANAFKECGSLKGMELAEGLSTVGDKAFAYCSGMEDIRFRGPMPVFGNAVFLNCGATIHCTPVHSGSWEDYPGVVVVDGEDEGIGGISVYIAIILAVMAIIASILILRRGSHGD